MGCTEVSWVSPQNSDIVIYYSVNMVNRIYIHFSNLVDIVENKMCFTFLQEDSSCFEGRGANARYSVLYSQSKATFCSDSVNIVHVSVVVTLPPVFHMPPCNRIAVSTSLELHREWPFDIYWGCTCEVIFLALLRNKLFKSKHIHHFVINGQNQLVFKIKYQKQTYITTNFPHPPWRIPNDRSITVGISYTYSEWY